MKTILITALLSAGAAFAAAGWFFAGSAVDVASSDAAEDGAFDASRPTDERLTALEKAVSEERAARQLLQEEVFYLTSELERLGEPSEAPETDRPVAIALNESGATSISREEMRRRRGEDGRRDSLVAAGFLPSQADWITQREQELVMQSIEARFEAERNGEPFDWSASRSMVGDSLRQDLGDTDYERYLEATGRSTSVSVSSVIESSPAQSAGLQPGDEIIRYDGERVFSMTDLTRQTMDGEPGQTVVVDIMRNGNLMQVAIPRGPVGITGGRRRY